MNLDQLTDPQPTEDQVKRRAYVGERQPEIYAELLQNAGGTAIALKNVLQESITAKSSLAARAARAVAAGDPLLLGQLLLRATRSRLVEYAESDAEDEAFERFPAPRGAA